MVCHKNIVENKQFHFPDKVYKIRKMLKNNITHSKKIDKITVERFLIVHIVFVLFINNTVLNENVPFSGQKMKDTKKFYRVKLSTVIRSTALILRIF